jgi:AraC-like DNA-binding protein
MLADLSIMSRIPSRPDRPDRRAATYVGVDWMVIVDSSAAYRRSAAIAPCLLLAEPGRSLIVVGDADQPGIESGVIAHGADLVSEGLDLPWGNLYLHFDPLSAAARALAALAGAPGQARACALPAGVAWTQAWFDRLVDGCAGEAEVLAWVEALRRGLVAGAPAADEADNRRIALIAQALVEDPAGRLDGDELAARVHCSAANLRRVFRDMCGMSMSRYQAWCRLHRAMRLACGIDAPAGRGALTAVLHEAGFYDAPHGFKTIRQYFGVEPSCVMPAVRRVA